MEVKVMSDEQIVEEVGLISINYRKIARRQAEISYKAGYEAHKAETCGNCDTPLLREGELYQKLDDSRKAGIREILGWLEKKRKRNVREWQAFLKSLGIK